MTDVLYSKSGLTIKEKFAFSVVVVIFLMTALVPQTVYAQVVPHGQNTEVVIKTSKAIDLLTKRFDDAESRVAPLELEEPKRVVREMRVSSTAYSSDVAQTDSTPCITADGFDVCANGVENVVAANFLPLGTKIQIPEIYGDRVFTVHDRMNRRYYYKVDIWMTSRERAIQHGHRTIMIRILEN